MSRAFIKEPDGDAAVEDLSEIPISPHPNIVTARGLQLIEDKITELRAGLEAQGDKDRATAVRLSRDLRYWIARKASAELAPSPDDNEEVRFGHRITLSRNGRKEIFQIVGQDEAEPAQSLLSYVSPLARAVIGAAMGDIVRMGEQDIEILEINPADIKNPRALQRED
jgi:transcription elongation GreA/GreB family factor